jgi:hypothetical protein
VTDIDGVEINGPMGPRYEEILTDEALRLIATLHRELGGPSFWTPGTSGSAHSPRAGRWTSLKKRETSARTARGG